MIKFTKAPWIVEYQHFEYQSINFAFYSVFIFSLYYKLILFFFFLAKVRYPSFQQQKILNLIYYRYTLSSDAVSQYVPTSALTKYRPLLSCYVMYLFKYNPLLNTPFCLSLLWILLIHMFSITALPFWAHLKSESGKVLPPVDNGFALLLVLLP